MVIYKKKSSPFCHGRQAPELHKRVQAVSYQLGLPKHSCCQMAVRAAVAAMEEAGGKAMLPLEFQAKYVPAKRVSRKKVKSARKFASDRSTTRQFDAHET